jgi:hypothetical protein
VSPAAIELSVDDLREIDGASIVFQVHGERAGPARSKFMDNSDYPSDPVPLSHS